MIKIQVIRSNGQPPLHQISATFDELGGNIGRAESNALVLPDPERTISRIHASIVYRSGRFFILSLGTAMPVYLNDQPLSNGQDVPIAVGDQIRIGHYLMQVESVESANAFPLPDNGLATGFTDSKVQPDLHSDSRSLAELLASPVGGAPQNSVAPKEKIPDAKVVGDLDPFAMSTSPASAEIIPPDFDPFKDFSPASEELVKIPPTSSESSSVLHPLLEPKERSLHIDQIINPANPLDNLPDQSNAGSVNPLDAISSLAANKVAQPVVRDDTPGLQEALPPWQVERKPADASSAIDEGATTGKTASDHEELLRAFLAGAGVSHLDMPVELTPQLMNLIGQLLRESTQGTLDLLLARTLTKREMRAEMTMIAPRENNPLKFSPNVEVALTHLLTPKGQGFMTPSQSLQDAYDDLRAHQFGFMAGMRAALSGVLERFNPSQLERRLTQKSVIDALFPMNRRAKLWDLFTERYSDISREAEEDFHVLLGKEFLRAYEAQIAKLAKEGKKR